MEYEGVRVGVMAYLEKTRIPIQIDIGFADTVTPAAQKLEYPILLDFPAPQIYGYPRETIVAEKIPGDDRSRNCKQPDERFLRSMHDVRGI